MRLHKLKSKAACRQSAKVHKQLLEIKDILENRFGRFYAHGGSNQTSAELVARGEAGHQRASEGANE